MIGLKLVLCRVAIVFLICSTGFCSHQAAAKDEKKQSFGSPSLARTYTKIDELVKRYFPRSSVKTTSDSIHLDFKARKLSVGGGNREIQVPGTGGIVVDLAVKDGEYEGGAVLPLLTHETLYTSIVMAPYSKNERMHLYGTFLYPSDTAQPIVDDFKEAIQSFADAPKEVAETPAKTAPQDNGKDDKEEKSFGSALASKDVTVPDIDSQVDKTPPAETASASDTKNDKPSSEDLAETVAQEEKPVTETIEEKSKQLAMAGTSTPPSKPAAPKASPKPTPQYFKGWLTKFYQSLKNVSSLQSIAPYYSRAFCTKLIQPATKLGPQVSYKAALSLRAECYLVEWHVDRVQKGPGGCMDVIALGRLMGRMPSYVIYRMVPEDGTWKIDSGRLRAWYSR